jgi:hypothetical protein
LGFRKGKGTGVNVTPSIGPTHFLSNLNLQREWARKTKKVITGSKIKGHVTDSAVT